MPEARSQPPGGGAPPLPPGFRRRVTPHGERWYRTANVWGYAPAFAVLSAAFWGLATAASGGVAGAAGDLLAGLCVVIALGCLVGAVGLARSGVYVDDGGVTARGALRTRRIEWLAAERFFARRHEYAPGKPVARVHARTLTRAAIVLPGIGLDGLVWNADRHLRGAAALAAALEHERVRRRGA